MQPRDLLFGSATFDSQVADAGRLILRAFTGLALALGHGWGKIPPSERFIGGVTEMGFPAPELFAWLAGLAEFGGGLLLAVGLLTRPAALFVLGNMTVVVLVAHAGDPFGTREKGLLFGAIALFYLLAGAGRYALDAFFRSRTMTAPPSPRRPDVHEAA